MTLAELRAYVRDLTGIYSTDLLPDTLLNRWLQEAYTELNRDKDWPWVIDITSGTIAEGAVQIPLPSSSGRVKEVVIKYANGEMYQIPSRRSLVQSEQGDDGFFYDHDHDNAHISLSKPIDATVTYYVNYMRDVQALSEFTNNVSKKALTNNVAILTSNNHNFFHGDKITVAGVDSSLNGTFIVTDTTTNTISYNLKVPASNIAETACSGTVTSAKASLIPDEFEAILAYRAAIKVLNSQSDDSKRAQAYGMEYAALKDALETEVIVDEDIGPIQIAGSILRIDGRTIGRTNLRFRSL